jgi:hypothetical protein
LTPPFLGAQVCDATVRWRFDQTIRRENIMSEQERIEQSADSFELIELGRVSDETKGNGGSKPEPFIPLA